MHRFVPDPANPPPPADPAQVGAIKRWTRELLGLGDDTAVTVGEIHCLDAHCPLVETVILVFDSSGETRQWRFTRPKSAVTKVMLHHVLASSPQALPTAVGAA